MAIRRIVQYNPNEKNSVLRNKARKVTKFNERLHKLLDDMAETMYDAGGVGLAAPQVGISKRVIVVDVGEKLYEMINPEIVERSGEQIEPPEGCLSIQGLIGDVRRAQKIRLRGYDRHGKEVELEAEGYLSRAFQHEIDHLNGVLFIDVAERVYQPEEETD